MAKPVVRRATEQKDLQYASELFQLESGHRECTVISLEGNNL